jgi:hypothetical protein
VVGVERGDAVVLVAQQPEVAAVLQMVGDAVDVGGDVPMLRVDLLRTVAEQHHAPAAERDGGESELTVGQVPLSLMTTRLSTRPLHERRG